MDTDPDQDALVKKLDDLLSKYGLMPAQKSRLIVQILRLFTGVHRCNCELCIIDPKE